MKFKSKTYWNRYYNSRKNNKKPSNFAKFVLKNYLKKNSIVLDVASGDGRDAIFLADKAKKVIGIDFSEIAIKKNKFLAKTLGKKNVYFKRLSSDEIKKIKNKTINFIYARFFLHAVNKKSEDIFLKSIRNKFQNNTLIALEFRTIKDKLMKKGKKISKYERITDHYRRFISPKKIETKLKKLDFKILYKKVGINLSKNNVENPHLCRLIFSKI